MIVSLVATLIGLCLETVDDKPAKIVRWPVQSFTLAWEHTVEKQRWEEDYELRIAVTHTGATVIELWPIAARVRGSGAGMEPGSDAILRNGWYHYRPQGKSLESLLLARSAFARDYELCVQPPPEAAVKPEGASSCRSLASWPELATAERIKLQACLGSDRHSVLP